MPKNKYKAISTLYNGTVYHSKLEAQFAEDLDWRVKAKDIKYWERQVKIPINVYWDRFNRPVLTCTDGLVLKKKGKEFIHITNYFIDFVVTHNDNTKEYVEVKGVETDLWRQKWKLTEAILGKSPVVKLTVVK